MISLLFFLARVFSAISDWCLAQAYRRRNAEIETLHPRGLTPSDFHDFLHGHPIGYTKSFLEERDRALGVDCPDKEPDLVPGHRVFYESDQMFKATADPTWGTKP